MFGLFGSPAHTDPRLGKLVRRRGLWRGTIELTPGSPIPLALSGSRSAPSAEATQAAADLAQSFPAWQADVERALYEHYWPYSESIAAGEEPPAPEGFPRIATPDDVRAHATALFVVVAPLAGRLTVEIGYSTVWDDEHTLGVRFQGGRLIELCGSVLAR